MKGQVDGYHIAAQIRLLRQVHKGAIVVVEGDTDAKVFDKFIDSTVCTTEVSFGKPNLLEALDLLEDEGFPGILAIADSDFDFILEKKYEIENLILTEFHDLDLTIFFSSALTTYLSEYADRSSVKKHFNDDPSRIRKAILDACMTTAYCRLASERHGLKLYFAGLALDRFIDAGSLEENSNALLEAILLRSTTACDLKKLRELIEKERRAAFPQEQIVNGHDAAAVLGISLRKLLGDRRDVHTWGAEIQAGLRLAFDWFTFCETSCYRDLNAWTAKNAPYRVLPAR